MYTTLITAQQLAALPAQLPARTVIIDCRHDLMQADAGRLAYRAGHLPGALFADMEHDLADRTPAADGRFKGRHPLPQRAAWLATLARWGINSDTQVVAYDAHGGMFAARLWWMLRWAGHEAAAVLDGGVPAWQQAGYALSSSAVGAAEIPSVTGNIADRPALVKTVDADVLLLDIVTHPLAKARKNAVVDARAPDRFRGENETLDPVGGHIPGAKNRFFKENLQPDGRFKPAADLRAEWRQVIAAPQQSVMQCGSGVTACHNLLALEIAGLPGAALYPGSWSEWCSDPARPVATGA